ncbi:MAG: chromosomal replication initiator protein DnaA [Desulfobacteraceae bacterium]|nr:chromosomal replication initiator protein DnaA [Desulfobacteraceae bacterium]
MGSTWTSIQSVLQKRVPSHSYKMWLEPVEAKSQEDGSLTLSCPNMFFKKRVQDHYLPMIEEELHNLTGRPGRVSIEVSGTAAKPVPRKPSDVQLPLPSINHRTHMGRVLRRDFTFDQFVVGRNNDFAYCAALSLASKRTSSQNTLYLLSGTGMGKSHLSQATGHHILSRYPQERVYYLTAEDFTNEMVRAFRSGDIDQFKERYRIGCDVLLLEDIHYLSGKARTQVELALTLEALIEMGKKIVFSSCYPPAEIPKLDDKLRSCLSSGLISSIDPPDFKTRLRILQQKIKRNGQAVSQEVLQYLASELTDDVRQLESGLIGVVAKSSLLAAPINLELAESVVRNIVRNRKKITIQAIKKLVCREFSVSVADVVSRSRKQQFVRPRQIAIYLSRRYTDASLQAIGKSFNRYHATALHSIGVVERELKVNPATRRQVDILSERLENGDF